MEKYYTPDLEEFHVGFRYEEGDKATRGTSTLWTKTQIKGSYEIVDIGVWEEVRVKYLDREDIEELGWAYKGNHWFYKRDEYYEMIIDEYTSYFLHIYNDSNTLAILLSSNGSYSLEGSTRLFDGKIKNYNELKTLTKQIGII